MGSVVRGEEEKEQIRGRPVNGTEVDWARETTERDERRLEKHARLPTSRVKERYPIYGARAREFLPLPHAHGHSLAVYRLRIRDSGDERGDDLATGAHGDPDQGVLRPQRLAERNHPTRGLRLQTMQVGRAHPTEPHVQPVVDLRQAKSPLPADLVPRQVSPLQQAVQGALGELQAVGDLLQGE